MTKSVYGTCGAPLIAVPYVYIYIRIVVYQARVWTGRQSGFGTFPRSNDTQYSDFLSLAIQ